VKPSRSELKFASFLSYCPRGDTKEVKRSQDLVRQVKENRFVRSGGRDEPVASLVARRLRERALPFASEFLRTDVALVPVPRSARRVSGALWPGQEIAESLRAEGFGMEVLPCLTRAVPVPKAATSRSEERPKARAHFESLELLDPLSLPAKVTLVDDVVTRGAQLFDAAWRIWAARPDVEVRAFVVIRTMSAFEDFEAIAAPCTGRIEWRAEECRRIP
jgi:predicted amidophosphoribosyltransferase